MLVNIARVLPEAVPVPAGRRSRDRDRVGEEPAPRRRRAIPARSATHEPPIPADLMTSVFREYERRKAALGPDRLRGPARARDPAASRTDDARAGRLPRRASRAFTVDEYQDVNLLQQTLLELWLGERDELCVVGDDYQSIYAFTGRDAALPARRAAALPGGDRRAARGRTTARRPRSSRSRTGSSPKLEGAEKTLRAVRGRRARAGRAGARRPGGDGVRRRPHPRARGRGRPARRDRRPLPHERALGRLRAGVRRGGDPVPGARRRVPDAAGGAAVRARLAALAGRRWSRRPCATRPSARGAAARAAEGARRAGARPPGGPRAARRSRGALRRRRADVRGLLRRPRGAVRAGRGRERRRPAPHVPPREGARVRGRLPAAARGERSFRSARRRRRRRSPRSDGSSTSGITRAKRRLFLTWSPGPKPSRFLAELGVAAAAPTREAGSAERRSLTETPDVPGAPRVAARAGEGGRRSRVRRLPRLDARRDRRAPAADARRSSRRCPGSARRSSTATATTCSPRSRPPRERSRSLTENGAAAGPVS